MILRLLAVVSVVFQLSGLFVGGAQPVAVGLIPAPWDKLAHSAVFAFMTLALLLAGGAQPIWTGGRALVALRCGRSLLWGAAALAVAAGAADELHQASLPGRSPGWDDLVADALGVVLTIAWVRWAARSLPAAARSQGLVRVRERVRVRRTNQRRQRRRWFTRYRWPALAGLAVMSAAGVYAWLAHTDTSGRHAVVTAAGGTRAGVGAAAKGATIAAVERTTALAPITLPADDAPHATAMEWWYYNGHLRSANGARYSFHVAVFLHDGMVRHTVFHGSLTDLANSRRFTRQIRTAGLPTKVTQDGFDFQHENWRVAGSGPAHTLNIAEKEFKLKLTMADPRPPGLHRAFDSSTPGLLDFGEGGISYYYSRPRMQATGQVTIGGVAQQVSGEVWFDHQWGDFDGHGMGWNWFALQLDNGSDLMLYELFGKDGRRAMVMGSMSTADGQVTALRSRDITLKPSAAWSSPGTGIRYATGWDLQVLPLGRLQVQALHPASEFDARETTFNTYWEGAVRVTGAAKGQGFLEMSGYDKLKSLQPDSPAAAAR